nr:hypothetical protein [Candidatus Freyarchaeota archaeon]
MKFLNLREERARNPEPERLWTILSYNRLRIVPPTKTYMNPHKNERYGCDHQHALKPALYNIWDKIL